MSPSSPAVSAPMSAVKMTGCDVTNCRYILKCTVSVLYMTQPSQSVMYAATDWLLATAANGKPMMMMILRCSLVNGTKDCFVI